MNERSEVPGHGFGVSTIAMFLFFGTNLLLASLFFLINAFHPKPKVESSNKKKELSKPFNGTLECFTYLSNEFVRTGIIMAITYVCERHWIFDHATKSYSRDLFLFVLILFFAYAAYTIKPCHDLTLLGREQTEEWKGWMQFIFLLYHYFHAEEVYNSVRVMITCYVWMTGFGNFSFFYIKQDYGWLRVAQMMWRLNFAVLLLMWTHGNTYILYYICPLHTFYFLMVYVTMGIFPSINHTKWTIRFKLIGLAIIIYIIWDVNGGLFDYLFSFLGTTPIIGASNGAVWEWYFRTSLDHWSAFLGMIFALNFPLAEQFFSKAKGLPLIVAGIGFAVLTTWWFFEFYMKPKLEYNLTHSYSAIIPLISYIFFRNITPGIRSGVSASLHELGKTTLETYLLQHHVWLTSNAKTLLNITPGYPWINFALATILFYVLSKELYRLTMTLRGMILPDDKKLAIRNSLGLAAVLAFSFFVAWILYELRTSFVGLCTTCGVLAILTTFVISRLAPLTAETLEFKAWAPRFVALLSVFVVVGFMIDIYIRTQSGAVTGISSPSKPTSFPPSCIASVSQGHWEKEPCKSSSGQAFCGTQRWIWDNSDPTKCPLSGLSSAKAVQFFKGKRVVFVGDSIARLTYHAFNRLLDPKYKPVYNHTLKHTDLEYSIKSVNTSISFVWSPLVRDVIPHISDNSTIRSASYVIMGSALWDALHERDLDLYSKRLEDLSALLPKTLLKSTKIAWIQPTLVIDALLSGPEKRQFMTENIISKYRDAVVKSSLPNLIHVFVETRNVSVKREELSVDGVHYGDDVYDVIAQMVANGYALHFPSLFSKQPKKSTGGKVTGSMSSPFYGAMVILLSLVMLFCMDSFLGIGFCSLTIFGRSADWDAAYTALHRKIGVIPEIAEDSKSLLLNDEKSLELGHESK